MKNLFKKVFHSLTFAIIILLCQVNYAQFDIPKKPALKDQKLLYDYADLFSSQQQRELTDKLTHYSNETSTQILVIIIKSLNGENISLLGPKWGHEWGVGEKGKGNGVVILMSVQDRQIGIYPGYGAEQYITAGQGGELIRNRIIPHFKNGDYYGGIHTAVDGVTEMLKGVYKSDKKNTVRAEGDNETGGLFCLFAIIFVIVGTIIFNKGDKNNGGKGGGNKRNRSFLEDLATVIILSNSGSSSSSSSRGGWSSGGGGWSSGGGSSSGGGFGGFGGGGFSGGGSSGSW